MSVKKLAIISLVVLEIANMLTMKIDGALFGAVTALIAGLGGYELGKGGRRKR